MSFKPGDPRINRKGRPPRGTSFAEHSRLAVGVGGQRLLDLWTFVSFGRLPEVTKDSTRIARIAHLKSLKPDMNDVLMCSRFLADRAFGPPIEQQEHTGTLVVRWET